MYGLDNASGVNVMPPLAPVSSATPLWFTEGGAGLAASYPGQDWFNMVQAEMLAVLTKGGVKPEKGKLNQLAEAIGKIVNSADFQPSGSYATTTSLSNGLALKLDKTSVVQGTGSSTTQVMSQYAATKFFLKPGDFGFGGEAVTVPESTGYNGISQTSVIRGSGVPGSPPDSLAWGAVLHLQRSPDRSVQIGFWKGNIGIRSQLAGAWDDSWLLAYTEANTSKDRNGYLRTSTTTEDMQSVPIGASIIWNSSAPIPNNFWPNEGRSFSASEYPELAKIFTNLKLPDDRGYAIRAADNGRGIDTGRTVGTYQEDALQEISGSITNLASTSGVLGLTGAFSGANAKPIERAIGNENSQYTTIEFKASKVARTANETRMKNVAKILITRVK